jgi:HSP20 family protein
MLWSEFGRFERNWSPWSDIRQLQREMERLFTGRPVQYGQDFPPLNIWFNEENAIITAEMPGLDPRSIDISVKGDALTLSGSRKPVELKEGETYHRRERGHGNFTRTVKIPFQTDSAGVTASYEKGILKIELPRAEEDKPKKIQIKTQ